MRLIDADAEAKWASEHILDAKERYSVLDFLRDCSTVDAIPVVRCKNCEYFGVNDENVPYCVNPFGLDDPKPNGFCNYRRKKNVD